MNRKKSFKIIGLVMLFFVIMSYFSLIPILANNNIPYVIDELKILDQFNKDKIYSIGNELSKHDILVMICTKKTAVNYDRDVRDIYFNWLGKLNENQQFIVLVYYEDIERVLYYQDSNNLINDRIIEKINKNLKGYIKNNDMKDGILYVYSVIANDISESKDLNIDLTYATIKPKYKENYFKSMPFIFGLLIILVLGYSIVGNRINRNK